MLNNCPFFYIYQIKLYSCFNVIKIQKLSFQFGFKNTCKYDHSWHYPKFIKQESFIHSKRNTVSPLIPTSKNLSGMVVMRLSVRASFSMEEKNRRWWFLVSERWCSDWMPLDERSSDTNRSVSYDSLSLLDSSVNATKF